MRPVLQKKKSINLSTFIKTQLINLLPFQDEGVFIELLKTGCDQVYEFKQVALKTYKNKKISYKKKKSSSLTVSQYDDVIVVPIKASGDSAIIMEIILESGINFLDIKQELEELYFFITIFMDRINYIYQLSKKNQELADMNIMLELINKDLKTQIRKEIMSQYESYDVSRKMIKEDLVNQKTKQLCHEINNPLSLIQFDVMRLACDFKPPQVDEDLVKILVNYYNITAKKKERILTAMLNKDKRANNLAILKCYPILYQYLKMVFNYQEYQQVNDGNKVAIAHIAAMVATLAQDTYHQTDKMSKVDVNQVLKESVMLFRYRCESGSIKLMVNDTSEKCYVLAKKVSLVQVIINLIKNSVESLPKKGNREISISITKKETICIVEISDTGLGFSELDLGRFCKNGYQRIGLGIPIIKSLVKQINGHISWQKKNQGTSVLLELALAH